MSDWERVTYNICALFATAALISIAVILMDILDKL